LRLRIEETEGKLWDVRGDSGKDEDPEEEVGASVEEPGAAAGSGCPIAAHWPLRLKPHARSVVILDFFASMSENIFT
jgi:hypothetical protein